MEFTTLDDEIPGPSIACSGAFDENCPETYPQFPLGNRTLANRIYGQPLWAMSWWGLLAGGVFSPWIYDKGKGGKRD